MDEQLKSKLIEILSAIQAGISQAGSFAAEQLPDLARTYILYGRISETVDFLVPLLMFIVCMVVLLKYGILNTEAVERGYLAGDWKGHRIFATIAGGTGAAVFFGVTTANIAPMLMVWFAPKIWLLQHIARLIK